MHNSGFILGRTVESVERPIGFGSNEPISGSRGEIIRYRGDAPIVTIAPTGGGKTTGPVICNALTHPGQFICLDVKGAAYDLTADHRRAMGQEVHVLDLRDGSGTSDALNPIDIALRLGTDTVALSRSFAAEMMERTGNERDLFWLSSAETMLAGGISYLLHHRPKEDRNISSIFDLYTDDDVVYKLACFMDNTLDMNRSTKAAWSSFLNLPERETRPCVLASTVEHLRMFDSGTVQRVTSRTTIDLDALLEGKPMSIYIIVPPYRMKAYRGLLRLWISGLLDLLCRRTTKPEHRTLLMIDEAGQLGRLDALLTASTLMREYSVTPWSIWQNTAQLDVYGSQAKTLIDNAGAIQCFGMRNRRMAEEVAALIGGISADTLMAMKDGEQLLAVERSRPTITRQVRYYNEPTLAGLVRGFGR